MKTVEELAREAGDDWDSTQQRDKDFLAKFYDLVLEEVTAQAYKEAYISVKESLIAELVAGSGEPVEVIGSYRLWYTPEQLAGAVLRERERCAKVCEFGAVAMAHKYMRDGAERCAAAIRGQT